MPGDPMAELSLEFFNDLLDAPGPSGFEAAPASRWRAEAKGFTDQVRADVNGNSYARIAGTAAPAPSPVMLAGHVDEIGLIVVHIDEEGFLWFEPIGGWDPQVFVGQRVSLLSRNGVVAGVIGKAAIHMLEKEEREKVSKTHELWIDIGARNRGEASGRVRVGDAGVLAAGRVELPNRRVVSRSMDNRIGAFVVLEALRDLARGPAPVPVVAVATAQEEISHTGGGARTSATDLAPLAAVVVDVTHATDTPGAQKKRHGDVKLGGGPVLSRGSAVNPMVFEALADAADAEKIPYVVHAAPRHTGTDADAIFTSHRGVATALVSVPLRYMHTPNEMVALEDLEATVRLLASFVRRIKPEADFSLR
jgi:putative aminopeptidase FrvX